jgi:hypothetical protein
MQTNIPATIRILTETILFMTVFALPAQSGAADLDRAPINYSKAKADNAVTRLQERINSGKAKLTFEDDRGYAKSLLKELNVPVSSQVLVFSKTSLQRDRICPKTPRAIYFNDDVYVGFCLRGDVMEMSAVDPQLGTVFYTLDQEPAAKPKFTRHTDACLICHSSSISRGMPGHVVRSVYPASDGIPYLSAGSHRTDHTSPFKERWGGWYVTGKHGDQAHMGNWLLNKRQDADEGPGDACQNLLSLKERFTTSFYLSPHSDIVALMTLEHQAEMHNRLAFATLETRMALHYQEDLNKALNEKPGTRFDSTKSRIRGAVDAVVKYLLFSEEAQLTDGVEGTSGFAGEFAKRGPFDSKGRSLRQFDLQSRLFRYPCSYLIYSEAFDKLPAEVKDGILQRLFDVLTGKDTAKEFAHLTAEDRTAILEILRETKSNLPVYWRN